MFSPDRFDETHGAIVPEKNVDTPPTEVELRERENALKARYEDPYRKEVAGKILDERSKLRRAESHRIKDLQSTLSMRIQGSERVAERNKKMFDSVDIKVEQEKVLQQKKDIEQQQADRGFFAKMKYRFKSDPLTVQLLRLQKTHEEHAKEIQQNEERSREIDQARDKSISKETTLIQEKLDDNEEYLRDKKKLFEKTKATNRESREAIRDTFLSMEKGDLNVANLARDSNAVVVHTIPLDGWEMKTTAHTNQEVDTTKMKAIEKATLLSEVRPDVSASILSVDRVEDQFLFYPFGYILDGTIIASYDGDVGTKTDGTARRKKEERSGTLEVNTVERFKEVAASPAKKNFHNEFSKYNESIVHEPSIKAVLIDESMLLKRGDLDDTVTEYYSPQEQAEVLAKYQDSIQFDSLMVPSKGPHAGKEMLMVSRKRSATEKAIAYAQENHPELPIYIRKSDSIYTLDGKKVTAKDIYA